MVYYDILQSY